MIFLWAVLPCVRLLRARVLLARSAVPVPFRPTGTGKRSPASPQPTSCPFHVHTHYFDFLHAKCRTFGQKCDTSGQKRSTFGQERGTSGHKCGASGHKCPTSGQECGASGQKCPTSGQRRGTSQPSRPTPSATHATPSPRRHASELQRSALHPRPHPTPPSGVAGAASPCARDATKPPRVEDSHGATQTPRVRPPAHSFRVPWSHAPLDLCGQGGVSPQRAWPPANWML